MRYRSMQCPGWTIAACLLAAALLAVGCAAEQEQGRGDAEYAESMAEEHAGDAPVASSLVEDPPLGEIHEQRVAYARLDGDTAHGFFAEPAEGAERAPGIIVIHEWWGLNDNIEKMARKLAAQGYRALAVDLYEGKVASDPERAEALMKATFERTGRLESHLRQAADFLEQDRGVARLGVIGWCFGGGWSLRAGLMLGERLDAVVVYYGRLITDPDRLSELKAPLLGIFGEQDQGIPVETVRTFEAELRSLDKRAEIVVYPGVGHAFANPSGKRFDREAAEAAWDRTLVFLDKQLKP